MKCELQRKEAAKQQVSKTCLCEQSTGTLFSVSIGIFSSSKDSGSLTEACSTNIWSNKPGNSFYCSNNKYVGKLEQKFLFFRHYIFTKVRDYGNMNQNTVIPYYYPLLYRA